MANNLPIEKQCLVLSQLVEGSSIRSIERITGVHRDTIMRLMVRVADKALDVADPLLRNLNCQHIQVDEIWCFVGKKEKKVRSREELLSMEFGDQYVFVAMDSDTKLVPCFTIGKRTADTAYDLMNELQKRVKGRFQLSTDGYLGFRQAVSWAFRGREIDYGQIIKQYRNNMISERRYSPPSMIKTRKRVIQGNPDMDSISTSHIERQNLTIRMQVRRFARLTNAFSKKFDNLLAACVLHFFSYNFMRMHGTLGTTPAMAAGITQEVWNWNNLLEPSSKQMAA